MKKYQLIHLALLVFILSSCSSKNRKEAKERTDYFEANASLKSDIKFSYHKNRYIDSIAVTFKLDERSFKNYDDYKLKGLIIEAAYISKDTTAFISQISNPKFEINDLKEVYTSLNIGHEKMDSINYLTVQTIGRHMGKNILSHLYTYENSLSLINMEETYLDYPAFTDTNVHFKDISGSNTKIDSIKVTVKSDKDIDKITRFGITVNDSINFNFRNSIHANYENRTTLDRGIKMYGLLKRYKNFCDFKLDLSHLNIRMLHSVKVQLD
jgi:hypothetical protein